MRRVLMLAYYFPPLGGIGSLRAAKFAHYLPESEWDPVVVAPRNGAYYKDRTLVWDEGKVVRTGSLEISRVGKRMVGAGRNDTEAARVGVVFARVQTLARRWIYRPDAQIGWYPFALRAARRVMRERRCDAVFSSSFPITAHLVARRVHDEFGIPWVAEFRDLWTDLGGYDRAWRRRRDEATERELLGACTSVVAASPGYADALAARGARHVCVITNGFDPADFTPGEPPRRLIATYMGSYYPDRQDLGTALKALGDLARSGRLAGLFVRVVGECPDSLRRTLVEAGLDGSAESTGFVPHGEALRYLRESTLLLLAGPLDGVFPRATLRGHIPAKAFEYLGSGRPILYVGSDDADIQRLIRGFDGVASVSPGDVSGARNAILSLVRGSAVVPREGLDVYTQRFLARRLAQVLEAACERGGRGAGGHALGASHAAGG